MKFRQTEKDFQRTIVDLAKTLGWWVRHDRLAQQSAPGWPDLVCIRPPRMLFVELKSEQGRVTKVQAAVGKLLQACPGLEYYLWRPSDWDEIVERLL